jgi:hypothetical protein
VDLLSANENAAFLNLLSANENAAFLNFSRPMKMRHLAVKMNREFGSKLAAHFPPGVKLAVKLGLICQHILPQG